MTTTIDALVEALKLIRCNSSVTLHQIEIIDAALAQARAEQVEPVTTVADNSQEWAGMSGNQAWHLIFRHADGWGDIDKMMEEWRAANAPPAAPVAKLEPCATCESLARAVMLDQTGRA